MATHEINKPAQLTYYIAYTDSDIFAYGEVDPNQNMSTGQPYLYQTLNREEWVYKLIHDFNFNPDDPG